MAECASYSFCNFNYQMILTRVYASYRLWVYSVNLAGILTALWCMASVLTLIASLSNEVELG